MDSESKRCLHYRTVPPKGIHFQNSDLVLLPLGKKANTLRRLTGIEMRVDPRSIFAAATKEGIRKELAGRAELLFQLPKNISI